MTVRNGGEHMNDFGTASMGQNDLLEQQARRALRNGSYDSAITALMKAYGNEIYRYCLNTLGSDADAQDTLQTTFVQAFEGLGKYAENSSFRTWLYSIARHRCLDRIKMDRRRDARVEITDTPPELAEMSNPEDPRVAEILRHCLLPKTRSQPYKKSILFYKSKS